MDNYIADPQKYKSNAVASVIKVKTEAGIARSLGIKIERKNSGVRIPRKRSVAPDEIHMLKAEKVDFISEIVSLKSLNQQLSFQLNEQKKKLASIKVENRQKARQFKQNIEKTSLHSKISESQLESLKKRYEEEKSNDKKLIDKLVLEKKQLTARVNQLQACSSSNETHDDERAQSGEVNTEYEVDKLIADEEVGKIRYYLVRWKGFGRDDDTWEKGTNLSCPKIFEEYKKSKLN